MVLYEIGLKLQHDCPYNDLSRRYPSFVISQWCNSGNDVLEITCDDLDLFERLQKDIQQLAKSLGTRVVRKSFSRPHVQLVVQNCGCENIRGRVTPIFQKNNCLEIQPCVMKGGWEYYRLIAFSEKDVRKLFGQLEKVAQVEVISRRTIPAGAVQELFMISTKTLFGELTGKQLHALLLALESGYYHVPKKITTEEIAKRLNLPRTTYEEHLRKAESKILLAVTPYVQMGTRA
ncbi:MAG: helix-turn-helix domain-containing protein [Thaumarchaeota archaeon]|nr:helix-turn-helix domain-containing protein [Nitrososphaerota archaeon]MBI3022699.1 helix-turn-helix domain-containing protein [Nitrososphaerota archaeon]MBI3116479.1 helix-turn-helix domain-containing protein [Nitrososphaerota archaeon]MCS4540138.1 helix-turn-helix domain-containing protein [Nitrososphaerota archaeon]